MAGSPSKSTSRVTRHSIVGETDEIETPRRKNRTLDDALIFFKSIKPDDILRGNVRLHLSLDVIIKHSMSHGLSSIQISDLMDIIVSPHLKRLSIDVRSKLVKCLIPCDKVPQSAAFKAIMSIGTNIFSKNGINSLHSILLRWLLLIYNYLDGFDQLHKLYNVIFNFIQSYLLLPHACHLLFLLTRKHDVQLYKVQKLLELSKKVGQEPCIMGLLLIYKVYCPHLVTVKLHYGNKVFFKAHDKIWRSTILDIVNQREQGESDFINTDSRREKQAIMPKSKHQRLLIPEQHNAAKEVEEEEGGVAQLSDKSSSVPYNQIDTFTEFVDNFDKIEYPSQIAAILACSELQLFLSCNPDPVALERLGFWITHVLNFGFRDKNKNDQESFEKLLKIFIVFSNNYESLPVIQCFLNGFLETWDGQTSAPIIYSLVALITSTSYQELFEDILKPLHQIFFSSDIYGKVMCLSSLTKLLKVNLINLKSCKEHTEDTTNDSSVLKFDCVLEVLSKLVKFISDIMLLGLRIEDDHQLLQHVALDFLHVVCQVIRDAPTVNVGLPIETMQRLLLSSCPATLAQLCNIINMFKSCGVRGDALNGFLLDTVYMLWKGKLFTRQDHEKRYPSMFSVSLPPEIPADSLTIFTGEAFLGFAYMFLKETQPEGKKVHPKQIKKFKDQYLHFLEREGFPEFKKFVDVHVVLKPKFGKSMRSTLNDGNSRASNNSFEN